MKLSDAPLVSLNVVCASKEHLGAILDYNSDRFLRVLEASKGSIDQSAHTAAARAFTEKWYDVADSARRLNELEAEHQKALQVLQEVTSGGGKERMGASMQPGGQEPGRFNLAALSTPMAVEEEEQE
jgi:hypothetical protein